MGLINLTPGVKSRGGKPTIPEPEWAWAWDRLIACVPMLDSGTLPLDIVSGQRITVADGAPVVRFGQHGSEGFLTNDAWHIDPWVGPSDFPVTLAVFVKIIGTSESGKIWLDLADSGSTSRNIQIIAGISNRTPAYAMRNGGLTNQSSVFGDVGQGDWHSVGATFRAQTDAGLYVNGVSAHGPHSFNAAWFVPNRFSIGRFGDQTPGGNISNGAISIAYVWSKVLNADQFKQLHLDPFGMFRPDFRVIGKAPDVVGGLSIPVAMHSYRRRRTA